MNGNGNGQRPVLAPPRLNANGQQGPVNINVAQANVAPNPPQQQPNQQNAQVQANMNPVNQQQAVGPAQQNQAQHSTSDISSMFRSIKMYDGIGEDAYLTWLEDLNRVATAITNPEKFRGMVVGSLNGYAGKLMSRFIEGNPNATWDQMKELMNSRFLTADRTRVAKDKLKGLKQKQGQTTTGFADEIVFMAEDALPGRDLQMDFIQEMLVDAFIDGIADYRVAEVLFRKRPRTLDEARNKAIKYESASISVARRRATDPHGIPARTEVLAVAPAPPPHDFSDAQSAPTPAPDTAMSKQEFSDFASELKDTLSKIAAIALEPFPRGARPQILATNVRASYTPNSRQSALNRRQGTDRMARPRVNGGEATVMTPWGDTFTVDRRLLRWNPDGTPVCINCNGPHLFRDCPQENE